MCGIVGWAFDPALARDQGNLNVALGKLEHRGPDENGTWCSPDRLATLGHTRLSVVELSAAGAQPMHSECGRHAVVFNGEIYNHPHLRFLLEKEGRGPSRGWRGSSDTETLVAAIAAWGHAKTLERAVGMFALASWDLETRTLTLARDAIGEKPLYAARLGQGIAFASELKALTHLPGFDSSIDFSSLADYLELGYVPAPGTIYVSATKVLPGTFVQLRQSDLPTMARNGDFLAHNRTRYWRVEDVIASAQAEPFSGGVEEAVAELEKVLGAAVGSQMVADVPLGAFLSGGIDSTAVVALMQSQSKTQVKTFTIGFEDPEHDESAFAKLVADRLGTDHSCVVMTQRDLIDRVPAIPGIWDEPFADSSQLPTLLVSEVARRRVTVSLSGDGGDELFSGYSRYSWLEGAWPRLARVPRSARVAASLGLNRLPHRAWDTAMKALPSSARHSVSADRLTKLAHVLPVRDPVELHMRGLMAGRAEQLLMESPPRHVHPWHSGAIPDLASHRERAMFRDLVDYLPDDVLVKVDRAAMSTSLETRAPFLSPPVIAFAWSLPMDLKFRAGTGKFVLRRLVGRYVGDEVIGSRPKAGFAVPLASWLRGPLRDWSESLLTASALRTNGLRAGPIHRAWSAHLSGKENHQYLLWNILMYQAWAEHRP